MAYPRVGSSLRITGHNKGVPDRDQSHRIRRVLEAARLAERAWQMRYAVLAGLAAVTCVLAVAAILVMEFGSGVWFAAAVALLTLLAACIAVLVLRAAAADRGRLNRLLALSRRLEARIESYEDLRWQMHDGTNRVKDLLQNSGDILVLRGEDGRVKSVNEAFTSAFGLAAEEVVGRSFEPVTVPADDTWFAKAPGSDSPDLKSTVPVLPGAQLVETRHGHRWIAWFHFPIPDLAGGGIDRQTIGRDVTDNMRQAHELAVARDAAQAADRAKSRFLASMSHEIRTPMNGIMGMAGLLSHTRLTPEQVTYTGAIKHSADTLLKLIDEILDFSKIEAGRLELECEPVELDQCLQNVVELLAPRAQEKGLEFAWMIDLATPRMVVADPMRLHQILFNLVGNAIKFTRRGGVTVRVASRGVSGDRHEITFAIRDTGPGLTPKSVERVFREFERGEPPMEGQESGTGLGLAIARQLARRMDGDITVVSRPGCGALFTLTLRLPAIGNEPRVPVDLSGRRVLLVSSHLLESAVLSDLIRMHGAEVVREASCDAISEGFPSGIAACGPFDVVVFDAEEDAEMAGAALAALRQNNGNAHDIRGIVLAPGNGRDVIDRFREFGIDGFLVRPVRPHSLMRLLAAPGQSPDEETLLKPRTAPVPVRYPGQPVSPDLRGLRVLVAEDNDINALLAEKILARLKCLSSRASNGQIAVDMVAASLDAGRPYDAILMDLHMPVLDGFAATREIKRLSDYSGHASPAIVAVTANAFSEDRERCMAAGLDGYLAKPFEPADLERVLAAVCGTAPGMVTRPPRSRSA